MLNSVGIKTFYITGWAFSKDQISGYNDNTSHTWTAALINGRWIELDATWGLFEGIPAGHIIKNIGYEACYYEQNQRKNDGEPSMETIAKIEMIADNKEIKELFENDTNEDTTVSIKETYNDISEEIANNSVNKIINSDINDVENSNKRNDENEEDTSKKEEENPINKPEENNNNNINDNNFIRYQKSYCLLIILLILC